MIGRFTRADALRWATTAFLALLFLFPLYWTFVTALKDKTELLTWPPIWWPASPGWGNFAEAWTLRPFATFFINSTLITVLSTIGQMLSSSLVAFGFARFAFPGRNLLFMVVLAAMMVPWDVTMIPRYMEFNWLGWINTLKPLIVPNFFGSPYFIFLLRQFIMTVPIEFDEAAKMDGANMFQIYWKIHLPLMLPALALVGAIQVMWTWNDYLGPLIFLNDESTYTLALGLAQLRGLHGANLTAIAAMTVILCLPPLLLFLVAQRYIMDSSLSSGIKG
jgi:multiple sugar transport system permease protein